MIPSIVVAPPSIHLHGLDSVQRRLRTLDFITFWISHAILLHGDGTLEESPLLTQVMNLPQATRTLWVTALKKAVERRLVARGPQGWGGGLDSGTILAPPLRGRVDLALVSPELFAEFADDEGQYSHILEDPSIEVCRFDSVRHCRLMSKLAEHRTCIRDQGTSVEQVWEEFFQPYLNHAGSVTIIDRFAITSHLNRLDGKSGLYRLLRGIRSMERGLAIRLYSATPEGRDRREVAQDIAQLLNRLGWHRGRFELFMLADEDFHRLFHFRYFRFDLFCRLKTDAGLEIIQGDALYRPRMPGTPLKVATPA